MSEPIFHDQPPDGPLAELGRFASLKKAREYGLVLSAMEIPHWIPRQGREYILGVQEADRARAAAALAEYEREEQSRPVPVPVEPLRIPKFGVAMAVLGLAGTFAVQGMLPGWLVERGIADDLRIRAGEWWRLFTALTLHGDLTHLVSNLSLGLFVFAFCFARFGAGVGILGLVLGGALGNALNTLAHAAQPHRSLGSSTALFAGLGLLAGAEVVARLIRGAKRAGLPLLVPLGAGLAFLSLFGGGGGQNLDGTPAPVGNVDLLAHLFGLISGLIVGVVMFAMGMRTGARPSVQVIAGWGAVIFLGVAWWCAVGKI